jgi:hypothetical protein
VAKDVIQLGEVAERGAAMIDIRCGSGRTYLEKQTLGAVTRR